MRAFGLTEADYEGDLVQIWPENLHAVQAFSAVSTQWRYSGMGGPSGLDYPAVFATVDRLFRALTVEARDDVFADMQIMERAALSEINKK